MSQSTFVELSNQLYFQFVSFKKTLTKAQILDFLVDVPNEAEAIQAKTIELNSKDNDLEISALNALVSLKKYLIQFPDDQVFFRNTLSVNTAVNIKMIKLSKNHPVSNIKKLSTNSDQFNSAYITPYNDIELLEMALQVAKDLASAKSK